MNQTRSFALPDLGEGLTEAEILSWQVSVGEVITVDQPVAEVETAKASVEVPCPFAGTVTELHGSVGDVVAVGAPLVTIAQTAVPEAREGSAPVSGNGAAGEDTGSGAVLVGYGTSTGERAAHRRSRGTGGPPVSTATGGPPPTSQESSPGGERTRVVSPLVRRMAREHGIDVASVHGTGEDGLVLRRDVEGLVEAQKRAHAPSSPASAQPEAGADAPGTHRIPLRGTHRAMADRMTRSRREIPEATVWVDADATGLVELRRELNEAAPDRPVSIVALVARFALLGLARFPELNSHFDAERGEVVRFDQVHLGCAAQTPRGLVVPVVRDAHRSTARELSARLSQTSEAARAGTLGPEAMLGGTFTVNNYGVFGVDGSAAIINHPEAAILGMGRIVRRPWIAGDEVVARPVTELTLTFDHRVCDGGVAGGFLRFVADCVERPQLLIGDL